MGAQDFRQNILRYKMSFSPCRVTALAICMIGSVSGSGNIPEINAEYYIKQV